MVAIRVRGVCLRGVVAGGTMILKKGERWYKCPPIGEVIFGHLTITGYPYPYVMGFIDLRKMEKMMEKIGKLVLDFECLIRRTCVTLRR